ncbi:MAG: hypothetical protein AAB757_00680 [Patescibacteria group bacterium]
MLNTKGLIPKPEITEENLDELVKSACKNGYAHISVITLHSQSARLTFRIHRTKGFNRVEIDTHSCNWDISEVGRMAFMNLAKNYPENIKDPYCGKCIMRVYVKHDDKKMWGVGLWLSYMLEVLRRGENLMEIKIS